MKNNKAVIAWSQVLYKNNETKWFPILYSIPGYLNTVKSDKSVRSVQIMSVEEYKNKKF